MTKAALEVYKKEIQKKLNDSNYYSSDRLQLLRVAMIAGILEEKQKQTELLEEMRTKLNSVYNHTKFN